MIPRPVTNDQRERQLLKAESLELTALLAAQQVGGCHFQRVWVV